MNDGIALPSTSSSTVGNRMPKKEASGSRTYSFASVVMSFMPLVHS